MRRPIDLLLGAALLLLAACAQPAPTQPQSPAPDEPISSIQATTVTKTNTTAANVDSRRPATRSVTFTTADFAAGSTVDKAVVTLKFRRFDTTDGGDGCNAPGTSGPRADEMFYFLTAPDGTKVVLIESFRNGGGSGASATYESRLDPTNQFTVVFDDTAAASVQQTPPSDPVSGTFKPVQPLSAFVGKAAIGTWTLTVGDSGGGDITCHDEFSLTLTASPDTTAPTATPSFSGTAGTNGWYTSDVTVNWNWADNSGGSDVDPANCTISSTSSGEGGAVVVSATCKDKAGNTGSSSVTLKIDKTPPSITLASRLPAANPAGWNNTDVAFTWNCTDGLSGVVSSTVNQVVSSEGSNLSATGICTDNAGNTATNILSGLKIDKTAPTVSAAATAAPNANGWYTSDVTVRFTCSDNVSGVVSCPADQIFSSEGSSVSSTAQTITDPAGNSSNPSNVVTVRIDKTPPSITFVSRLPAANGAGWNNTDVTLTWNCTDGLSGVTSSTVTRTVSTQGSGQSATGTCTDNAGNTASNTQTGINIDKTAPTLAPTVSPNPVLRNLSATATPNVSDGLSGIAAQSCPAISTNTLGSFSVTCTATDRAGNTATASAAYTVLSSSQALSNLRSQVQSLPGLGFVNRTLLLATLSQAQVYLSNGVRSGAVSSLNTFIGQVDGIRGISGGLTNAQANALIAQVNLIIQSINAGG